MKKKKIWATNDSGWPEDWAEDWGDLLDRLMGERAIEKEQDLIGEEYFEGDAIPVPLRRLIPIDTIIDVMNEEAWDVAGEYAEDWPDLTSEDKMKLEDLIVRFLSKKHAKEFYDVKNIVKKTITKDDIRA
jgi:hypothetical protein